jgi:CheY-like chemotaxis protein
VQTTDSADAALKSFDTVVPDVLISDIGMPGSDGYELIEKIRAFSPDRGGKIPAVALTAYARSEDKTRALRSGFQTHLTKPVEMEKLVSTISKVAGRN